MNRATSIQLSPRVGLALPVRLSVAFVVGIALWTTMSSASSDELAQLRSGLESQSPVWVGQETTFYVELLSASFFSGSPHFAVPEIPGAVVLKVDGRPVMGSTTIDGESWTSQRHTFRVYAQRPGEYEIAPFAVRFAVSEGFKRPAVEQRLMTEPIRWEAKMPPGAEGLSLLISTSSLEASQTWQGVPHSSDSDPGEPISLAVGDAITRSIKLEAEDVPGMALPAVSLPTPEGMSSYPKAPVVDDRTNRGTLTGSRSDSTTYVCQNEGFVTLPALVVTWWDIKSKKLHRITLDGLRLEVTEPEVKESESVSDADVDRSSSTGVVLGFITLLIVSVTGIYSFRGFVTERWTAWNQRHTESESAAFAAVKRACRGDDPAATYNALMRWISKRSDTFGTNSPGTNSRGTNSQVTMRAFMHQCNDATLETELVKLERAAMDPSRPWSGSAIESGLVKFRRSGPPRDVNRRSSLPQLNP